jgi:two-component system cell cycle sensor histidine kinase/response regulator CckA
MRTNPRIQAQLPVGLYSPASDGRTTMETIVVLQDHDPSLEALSHWLGSQGYAIMGVDTAEDAIRISRQHPGPIQLLITDVILRAGYSPFIAQQITTMRAETAVLFLASSSLDQLIEWRLLDRRALESGTMFFLEKPLQHSALLCTVRGILESVPTQLQS